MNYKDNASTNLDNNPNFKTVVLDDILKPFYYAAQTSKKTVSFDDNGFSPSQYNLRYSLPTADNHTDVGDWLELDPATGKLSVKISTPNTYNIAAVNNKAYVKVDLFAGSGNAAADLIASRIVRVDIVSTPVTPVDVVGNIDWQRQLSIVFYITNFISGRRFFIWHTLLVMVASAAVHVQVSALYQLFLRVTHSSTSILIHASIAVLVQLSVLFQLFLRANYYLKKKIQLMIL